MQALHSVAQSNIFVGWKEDSTYEEYKLINCWPTAQMIFKNKCTRDNQGETCYLKHMKENMNINKCTSCVYEYLDY